MALYESMSPTTTDRSSSKVGYFQGSNITIQSVANTSSQNRDRLDSRDSIVSDISRKSTEQDDMMEQEDTIIHRNFMQATTTPISHIQKFTDDGTGDDDIAPDMYFSFGAQNEHPYNDALQDLDSSTTHNEEHSDDSDELEMQYGTNADLVNTVKQTAMMQKANRILNRYYTLDDAIKTLQFGRYHYVLLTLLSFIYFAIALQAKITNILYLLIEGNHFVPFDIPHDAEFLLYIAFNSGGVVGVYFSSLADKFGRKTTCSAACILLVAATILQICANDFKVLVIARLFVGLSCAVAMICIMVLLMEYVPNSVRFRVLYFLFLVGIISEAIGSLLGYIVYKVAESDSRALTETLIDEKHWHGLLIVLSVPIWLLPILNYAILPKSPHFLAVTGDSDQIMKLFKIINEWNQKSFFVTLERQSLVLQKFEEIAMKSRGSIVSLFELTQYRRSSVLLSIISFVIWFTFASMFKVESLFVTYLRSDERQEASQDEMLVADANTNFVIQAVEISCDLIGAIVVLVFLNFVDRKKILMFGFGFASLLLVVVMLILLVTEFVRMTQFGDLIGIFCVFVLNVCVDMCYYVTEIYILEVYPTVVRATALGFIFYGAGSIGLIVSISISIFVEHTWILILLYLLASIIGLVCCTLLHVETKNRPLEDVLAVKQQHQYQATSSIHHDYVQLGEY